jgi:S-adenosylmethionine:tRNA ribosyltransferase-isomerase
MPLDRKHEIAVVVAAAFCGLEVMKRAYAHAIGAGYRFYSYGDACLLFRP